LFGEQRLLESVRTSLRAATPKNPTVQQIQDAILADVHRFVGSAPQFDDIALMILIRG
jgi:serine phosphatase RsbU (regulator of sigma subunit)